MCSGSGTELTIGSCSVCALHDILIQSNIFNSLKFFDAECSEVRYLLSESPVTVSDVIPSKQDKNDPLIYIKCIKLN